MYKKVLLAYDGSIEGRLALREGAKLAQFCGAEVFLLAVVEPSFGATLEGGVMIPMDEQIAIYKSILAEGVERLRAMGFSPTARLGMGAAGQEIAGGRRRDRSKPSRRGASSHRAAGAMVVRLCRHLPNQAASLQCLGRPNRNQRRSICPADDGRRTGVGLQGETKWCQDQQRP